MNFLVFMKFRSSLNGWLLVTFISVVSNAQQIADINYAPSLNSPAYAQGDGPLIFIDAGHRNFHTKDGRYQAFAHLLERDGYRVEDYLGDFENEVLSRAKILVISNALSKHNVDQWYKPVFSAFTSEEIETVRKWVSQGGGLFLIADHMPMGGAAMDLAAAFGFRFTNGFAIDTSSYGPSIFSLDQGNLGRNLITMGRNKKETVERAISFTGQAFQIPEDASPILLLDENFLNFLPDTAWVFNSLTLKYSAGGWCQGAYKKYGKGKVVAFGEAAMFTAQLAGPEKIPMGMNHPIASKNYQLLLNIIHWLDDLYE